MSNKKNLGLRLARDIPVEELINTRKGKTRWWTIGQILLLISLILLGHYILLTNQYFSYARVTSIYPHRTSEQNRYEAFSGGIVRYNRDGVMFLNSRNQEVWIHSGQFANPVFEKNGDSFIIADRGGNNVKVFNRHGLQGEFETFLPIERAAVSSQGIVSAILRNDNSPLIVTYDMAGTILVEQHVPFATMGYPTALALSDDGTVLVVAYLSINGARLTSRVVHYNFTNPEEASPELIVGIDVFEDTVVADIVSMGEDTFAVITDGAFIIYEGDVSPSITAEVNFEREVRSVFNGERHLGYIVPKLEGPGYELRLFDLTGQEVVSLDFVGEYSSTRMIGNDIIMFDGMDIFIISRWGVVRFQGSIDANPMLIKPAFGINRYHVMTASDMLTISLTN